jgi:hypothetical protein
MGGLFHDRAEKAKEIWPRPADTTNKRRLAPRRRLRGGNIIAPSIIRQLNLAVLWVYSHNHAICLVELSLDTRAILSDCRMNHRVDQYEREARAAEEAADKATDAHQREAFLKVAEGWRRLANLASGRWKGQTSLPKDPGKKD